ncbi:MAG TPA: hypothetical protein VGI70_14525, partial [Polyangiales bacterium]
MSLPSGRWARASDHPSPNTDGQLFAEAEPTDRASAASLETIEPKISKLDRTSDPSQSRASRTGPHA